METLENIAGGNIRQVGEGRWVAANVDMGGGVRATFNVHPGTSLGRTGMVLEGQFSATVSGRPVEDVLRVKVEFPK